MKFSSLLIAGLEHIKRSLPIILLLRKPDFVFAVNIPSTSADSCEFNNNNNNKEYKDPTLFSGTEGILKSFQRSNSTIMEKEGLFLYYNQFSFYSQKVVLALHEKKLPFKTQDIDLNGEQYKPEFLKINPRGEVPVLQDTGKIISDSGTIIDYLEDNFSNGDTPRLVPTDQGVEIRQKVTYFRNLIDQINGNVLTIGSFYHPELATGSKKVPFIGPVRKQLLASYNQSATNLNKYALENPEAKELLMEKAQKQIIQREKLLNKEEFLKVLKQTEEVFDKVEEELAQHLDDKQNWWLCSDRFTVADVYLTILLVRINQIGMEPYFWTDGKRPLVEKYFEKVQKRDSYVETIPTTFNLIKTIFKTQSALLFGVSITALLTVLIGGWFLYRKIHYKVCSVRSTIHRIQQNLFNFIASIFIIYYLSLFSN